MKRTRSLSPGVPSIPPVPVKKGQPPSHSKPERAQRCKGVAAKTCVYFTLVTGKDGMIFVR